MMNRTNLNPQVIKNNLYLLFESALKSAFKSLFSDIEKKNFLRAEHTEDPLVKLDLFNQLELIKKKNSEFEQFFFNLITTNKGSQVENNWLDMTGDRNLALQIEDLITHAKAKYGVEHAQFESRINWLFINFPEHFPNKIYTLNFLVLNFLESTKIFSNPVKNQVIRSLGNQVLYKLEPLYILMNESLIQSGILVEVKSAKKETTTSHAKSLIDTLNSNEHSFNKELEESAFTPKDEIIDFINHCIETKHLTLAKKSDWTADEFVKNFITNLDHSKKSGQANIRISNSDHDILESIGSLLSAIINKKTINPIIKNKIIDLQTVFLMSAFSCSKFMEQPNHSGRLALIKISSIGTNPSLSLSTLNEAAKIIGNFIDNFSEHDERNFENLNSALDTMSLNEPLPQSSQSIPKPIKDLKGITQRCSILVTDIIKGKTSDSILSAQSKAFIHDPLREYLTDTLIRQGRQSPAWLDANNLLDLIIQFETKLNANAKNSSQNIKPILDLIKTLETENKNWNLTEDTAVSAYISYLKNLTINIPQSDSTTPTNTLKKVESTQFANAIPASNQLPDSPQPTLPKTIDIKTPSMNNPSLLANFDESSNNAPNPAEILPNIDLIINHPAVSLFTTKHILNNEWFKVFISPDLPLRTLKPSKIDKKSSAIIFSNKNGVSTLSLPVDQFYYDTFNNRTHPVFESAHYTHELSKLIIELKNKGLIL